MDYLLNFEHSRKRHVLMTAGSCEVPGDSNKQICMLLRRTSLHQHRDDTGQGSD